MQGVHSGNPGSARGASVGGALANSDQDGLGCLLARWAFPRLGRARDCPQGAATPVLPSVFVAPTDVAPADPEDPEFEPADSHLVTVFTDFAVPKSKRTFSA